MEDLNRKYLILRLLLIVGLGALILRLYFLQIVKGEFFYQKSLDNITRMLPIPAARGLILSREGIPLTQNTPTYQLFAIPQELTRSPRLLQQLIHLLPDKKDLLIDRIQKARDYPPYMGVMLLKKLEYPERAKLEARKVWLPGIFLPYYPSRIYPYGSLFAHTLGYVQESSPSGRGAKERGVTGLEAYYDDSLMGKDGAWLITVNAHNEEQNRHKIAEPVPGKKLKTTLSLPLQQKAAKLMEPYKGAVILMSLDGSLWVLYSKPSYDPNRVVGGITAEAWKELQENPDKPMFHRAVLGTYPPGSLVKPYLVASMLSEGDILAPKLCKGKITLGDTVFHCWISAGHGQVDWHRAIVVSCDIYFYELARQWGIEKLTQTYSHMGFGKKTGIDLPFESPGLVADALWRSKIQKKSWYLGETIIMGIGQGSLTVTPLQMAVLMAGMLQGGKIPVPHLNFHAPIRYRTMVSSPEAFQKVQQALLDVVRNPEGTAYSSTSWKDMGGKTGTAQVAQMEKAEKLKHHAWFVGFAPAENPQFVCVVLLEHGEKSQNAVPIAEALLQEALRR